MSRRDDAHLPLVECCACDEPTFRRRHPQLGAPVRCTRCEALETDRLRGLAARPRPQPRRAGGRRQIEALMRQRETRHDR
ncbi:MAG: hypothetical protein OZ948_00415 [Deltaproteobacteria bacterium]|nr:hypothetical protein [Deltaproteobacteria bacterium]